MLGSVPVPGIGYRPKVWDFCFFFWIYLSGQWLPTGLAVLFFFFCNTEGQCEVAAASDNHQGRVRSFAHVRGNWATHVFLPFESTTHVSACITNFLNPIQKRFG